MATGSRHAAAAVHDDAESDESRSMPSLAQSVSSFSGDDLDEVDSGREILYQPELTAENETEITQGDWTDAPRGDGYQHAQREPEGQFGMVSGNWGNNWNDQALQSHMNYDLKSSPSHIIILQETMEELLEHLEAPRENGIPGEDGDAARGSGAKWQRRPTYQYIGFRGKETG